MKMKDFFKCPKCGDLSYENFIPNIGRHLLCPYCKTKFSFETKHLIGKGTKLGLVKRYSEVELNQLFSTTLKNTEEPVAEEPQEETSPESQKAEAVEVAVSELPKEDTTSIVETANEPAKEATSPEPHEAEAVEVAVAELPKEVITCAVENIKGSTYKEKSKIDSLPKIAEIKPHSIYPTCKPAVKTIDRNLRCITENEIIPKSKESLKISDAEIMPLDIVPSPLEIKPTPKKGIMLKTFS
jgi:predicted nucleic-acid-binding Zn-ribbon protein